jgi:DNA-binding beta-propeller fold protein YncE
LIRRFSAAAAVLVLVVAGCSSGDKQAREEPDEIERVHLDGRPSAVAVGGGFVWVADEEGGSVRGYHTSNLEPSEPIDVPDNPVAMDFDGTHLWVAHAAGELTRVSPGDGEAEDVPVPDAGSLVDVSAQAGAVWVADSERDVIVRLDPETLRVTSTVAIPAGAVRVVATEATVWVTGKESSVTPVDVGEDEAEAAEEIAVGPGPLGLVVAGDSVWVCVSEQDEVVRIDRRSRRIAEEAIKTGDAPVAVTASDGTVSVVSQDDRSTTNIDSSTGRRLGRDTLDTRPRDAAAGADRVWIVGVDPALLLGATL